MAIRTLGGVRLLILAGALLVASAGCGNLMREPGATFEITDWSQAYYGPVAGYSDFVYVYYKATNTGSVDIDYYEVWIEVRCEDGSTYQERTNGLHLSVGMYVTDYTTINVNGKKAVSASISKYELTSY